MELSRPPAVMGGAMRGFWIAATLVMTAASELSLVSGSGGRRELTGRESPSLRGGQLFSPEHRLDSPRMPPGEGTCDLCRDNWLFILGAGGRTGSTTAMAMFSKIPGFVLTGEHWGLLHEALAIVDHLKAMILHEEIAWINHGVDYHRVACSMQHLVKNVVLGNDFQALAHNSTVFGFKEIRYTSPEMLKFLFNMFPCARFVFTYRENTEVPVKAHEFNEKNLQHKWKQSKQAVLAMHEAFGNTTGLLGVENMSVDDYNRILNGMLGVKGCRFGHILHENKVGDYSYLKGRGNDTSLIEGECDLSAVDFRISAQQIEANKGRMWRLYNELLKIA